MADEDLKALMESMHSQNTVAHAETRRQFAETRRQFEETNRHFDVVAEDLKSEIRMIAEGLIATNEKFDRRFDGLETKVDRNFAETQAMIRGCSLPI